MTAEQAKDLKLQAEALTAVLAILDKLREDADDGDDAVEWVIEQLNQ